jgi:flagellar biosynthesis protein FliR
MERNRRFKLIFLVLFRALLFIAIAAFVYKKRWFNLFLCILALALTFLPSILEKKLKVDYPEEFEIAILFFIFASLFLGDINSFYTRYWWWDLFLHGLSAIILGLLAFSLVYILNKERKISLKPGFIALFAFCFALAMGALWEIFEFLIDSIFKTNLQRSGLVDTMIDLIVDMTGALLISLLGFLYAKGYLKFLRSLQNDFIKANPDIFGK